MKIWQPVCGHLEEIIMKMKEIHAKAKQFGVKSFGKKKINIIRTIQLQEGNTACFQTAPESCDQMECCWREDCLTH